MTGLIIEERSTETDTQRKSHMTTKIHDRDTWWYCVHECVHCVSVYLCAYVCTCIYVCMCAPVCTHLSV